MAKYQSFPGQEGDSPTLEKLKRLCLPSLYGKAFLDVGCNEGFFCGYAKFDGARRVVGIDQVGPFIARARRRFSGCEFIKQSWDKLPEGPFDVILLASALHYAEDQADLIRRLMEHLTPSGTLVLELGVVSRPGNEWVSVKRGVDERFFATWSKLEEVLKPYAWRHIGSSVMQRGDPVPRHVIHVRPRMPVAYLLMQPPAYGKSSISRSLFKAAGVTVISGDQTLGAIARGTIAAPEALTQAVQSTFSPTSIDQTVFHLFGSGLGEVLVRFWVNLAGTDDFALDAFVPAEFHAEVVRLVGKEGFMPVALTWEPVGGPMPVAQLAVARAEAYFASLENSIGSKPRGDAPPAAAGTKGFVEQVEIDDEELTIRGWAVNGVGALPSLFRIDVGGQVFDVAAFESQLRPDVQKHLGLDHALCGYRITTVVPGVSNLAEAIWNIKVYGGSDANDLHGPFQLGRGVQRPSA